MCFCQRLRAGTQWAVALKLHLQMSEPTGRGMDGWMEEEVEKGGRKRGNGWVDGWMTDEGEMEEWMDGGLMGKWLD